MARNQRLFSNWYWCIHICIVCTCIHSSLGLILPDFLQTNLSAIIDRFMLCYIFLLWGDALSGFSVVKNHFLPRLNILCCLSTIIKSDFNISAWLLTLGIRTTRYLCWLAVLLSSPGRRKRRFWSPGSMISVWCTPVARTVLSCG